MHTHLLFNANIVEKDFQDKINFGFISKGKSSRIFFHFPRMCVHLSFCNFEIRPPVQGVCSRMLYCKVHDYLKSKSNNSLLKWMKIADSKYRGHLA